jgi:hypothetical protein
MFIYCKKNDFYTSQGRVIKHRAYEAKIKNSIQKIDAIYMKIAGGWKKNF